MAMSESYKSYLNSAEWAKIKADIISIRGRQCEHCGKTKGTFHVHHLTYKRIFKEEPEDLVLLCQPCHKKQHPEQIKKARTLRAKAKKSKDKQLTTTAIKKKKISHKKKNSREINLYQQALTMAVSSGKGVLPRVEGVFHTEIVNGAVRLVVDL